MTISRDGRRIAGTDQGTGKLVYQVGLTTYSDKKKFDVGYDNIKWDREEEDGG